MKFSQKWKSAIGNLSSCECDHFAPDPKSFGPLFENLSAFWKCVDFKPRNNISEGIFRMEKKGKKLSYIFHIHRFDQLCTVWLIFLKKEWIFAGKISKSFPHMHKDLVYSCKQVQIMFSRRPPLEIFGLHAETKK